MGWPKGKSRKPVVADVNVVTSPKQVIEEPIIPTVQPHPDGDGSVLIRDNATISVSPGVMPALTNPNYDPFTKFKTDTKNFAYRAINSRATLRREREAQGWQQFQVRNMVIWFLRRYQETLILK